MKKKTTKSKTTKIPKINIPNNKERIGMKTIKGKTVNQSKYLKLMENKKIVFCIGPAGSGKSYMSTQFAVQELIRNNYEKIIITRPYIGAEIGMGHLPGSLEEKMDPFMRPIFDCMIAYGLTCEEIKKKIVDRVIEIVPILYARGRSFHNSIVIIDEAQNCNYEQLLLLITRFGRASKMIINGDISQSDLSVGQRVDLEKMGKLLSEIDDVGFVELGKEDIIREVIIKDILEKLEEYDK